MQVLVRQALRLEQETQPVNGVLEVRLGGGLAAPLQQVQIILYLFRIKVSGQALEMKGHRGHMAAVIVESPRTAAQDAYVALKTSQELFETGHLAAGPVEVLVPP